MEKTQEGESMTYKADIVWSIGGMLVSALLYHFIGFIITTSPVMLAVEQSLAMTMFGVSVILASAAGFKEIVKCFPDSEAADVDLK